jgi:hypothetical protein
MVLELQPSQHRQLPPFPLPPAHSSLLDAAAAAAAVMVVEVH